MFKLYFALLFLSLVFWFFVYPFYPVVVLCLQPGYPRVIWTDHSVVPLVGEIAKTVRGLKKKGFNSEIQAVCACPSLISMSSYPVNVPCVSHCHEGSNSQCSEEEYLWHLCEGVLQEAPPIILWSGTFQISPLLYQGLNGTLLQLSDVTGRHLRS